MNVVVVQTQFRNLSELVTAAGGSAAVAGEFAAVADALTPFAGFKVRDFADFLKKEEEYHRTNILPVVAGKGAKGPKEPKLPAAPPEPSARGRAAYDRI
ncbi:MAG: hypothetical protein ACRC7O_09570, partial [Fimbriiglobus sp.]